MEMCLCLGSVQCQAWTVTSHSPGLRPRPFFGQLPRPCWTVLEEVLLHTGTPTPRRPVQSLFPAFEARSPSPFLAFFPHLFGRLALQPRAVLGGSFLKSLPSLNASPLCLPSLILILQFFQTEVMNFKWGLILNLPGGSGGCEYPQQLPQLPWLPFLYCRLPPPPSCCSRSHVVTCQLLSHARRNLVKVATLSPLSCTTTHTGQMRLLNTWINEKNGCLAFLPKNSYL